MKTTSNLTRKRWLDRLADFLLGPAPQPIYVVGAAAFNGGKRPSSAAKARRHG